MCLFVIDFLAKMQAWGKQVLLFDVLLRVQLKSITLLSHYLTKEQKFSSCLSGILS